MNVSYDVKLNRTTRRRVGFQNYEAGNVGHEIEKCLKDAVGFGAMEIEIFKPSRTLLETCFQLEQRSHTVSTYNGFGTCRLAPVAWHLSPGTTCRRATGPWHLSISTDFVEVGGLNRRHPRDPARRKKYEPCASTIGPVPVVEQQKHINSWASQIANVMSYFLPGSKLPTVHLCNRKQNRKMSQAKKNKPAIMFFILLSHRCHINMRRRPKRMNKT